MATTPTVGHYHFDGWDLPTKYGWMHSGPGAQAAAEVQDAARAMADRMIASGKVVSRLLAGAEWVGAAAIAAGEAMRRGAGQLNQTAAETATADRCITELGESFTAAQHRVPAPNEVPSGLGDKFLYSATETFNVLSPFDVQSPLHEAMERRRELDQQANMALTEHMNRSRERVEAIPAVAAPAPMTVTGQSAAPSGSVTVGQPAGLVPATASGGSAPAGTPGAGRNGVASPPPSPIAAPGAGGGGTPLSPAGGPISTGLAHAAGGAYVTPPLGAAGSQTVGSKTAGLGSAGLGPAGLGAAGPRAVGARSGAVPVGGVTEGGVGARPGLGGRPVMGGENISGRGGAVGGAGRAGAHSFLHPPLGGRGGNDAETEHTNRYAQPAEHIVGELPLVAPAVLGETPEEEARRLRDGR